MAEYKNMKSGKVTAYVVNWDKIPEGKKRDLMSDAIGREVAAYCRKLSELGQPQPTTLNYPLPGLPKDQKKLTEAIQGMSVEEILAKMTPEQRAEVEAAMAS